MLDWLKGPDLWIWMGDNMYADGNDMDYKRYEYNKVSGLRIQIDRIPGKPSS